MKSFYVTYDMRPVTAFPVLSKRVLTTIVSEILKLVCQKNTLYNREGIYIT